MQSSFGQKIRVTIFGGSHEPEIGVTLEGLPKGQKIDLEQLEAFLVRRAPGNSPLATGRREPDRPVVRSGLHRGVTFGPPLTVTIRNSDTRSGDYAQFSNHPRPSHADYTAKLRYGDSISMSGGGPFSGRMTAPLCIAGGIALQILGKKGVRIGAHLLSAGAASEDPFDPVLLRPEDLLALSQRDFPTLSADAGERMRREILQAKEEGDSIGGVVECAALGCPAGIGGAMYDGVESILAPILFGIPAVRGVEFGAGFSAAAMRGSTHNDPFCMDSATEEIRTSTNHHGGILGGITSGMPIVLRVAIKPTPSVAKPQKTLRLDTKTMETLTIPGRHDPCAALRAVPVVEAAVAVGLLDLLV